MSGNWRTLLERAVTLCSNNIISLEDIQLSEPVKKVVSNNAALDSVLDDIEKQKIIEALEKTRWNKNSSSEITGNQFSRITLST